MELNELTDRHTRPRPDPNKYTTFVVLIAVPVGFLVLALILHPLICSALDLVGQFMDRVHHAIGRV